METQTPPKPLISRIFLKGLMAILPLALTVALIVWLLEFFENIFGALVIAIIGKSHYFPGLGLIVGLILVFLVGLIINAWLVQKIYSWADAQLKRIPLVKTLYSAICDLMNFFSKPQKGQTGSQVVSVQLAGVRLIGLVTRRDFSDLPAGIADKEMVAVYVPMSYQLGGFTVMIPKSQITPIQMTVEKAMRFAVTAGIEIPSSSTGGEPCKSTQE